MDSDAARPRWIEAPEAIGTPPLLCLTCFALLPNDERMASAHVARHDQEDRQERLLRLISTRMPGRHRRHHGF
jgi:hypothetical protein